MRTINDVRQELKFWGNFWASKEYGQGYASKSNIQALRETLQVGCAIKSDAYLFNQLSDSIHVPSDIRIYDMYIARLATECRIALRQRYIVRNNVLYFEDKNTYLYWLRTAERELL